MTTRHPTFNAVALATFITAMLVVGPPAFAAERPNIILIMADDMGFECVAANGGETYETPHLDKLAATGMRFEHCYSQPICTPSRVQIMTGRYNSANYIQFGLLDPKATTFGNVLQDAGYATCIVGKWQLKGGFEGPHQFGFDEFCLWQLIRRPNRYPNPVVEVNGKEVDGRNGEYGPDIVSDYACDFIERKAKGDKPFLVYYPMMLPHRCPLNIVNEINSHLWQPIIADLNGIAVAIHSGAVTRDIRSEIEFIFGPSESNFLSAERENLDNLRLTISDFTAWLTAQLNDHEIVSVLGI